MQINKQITVFINNNECGAFTIKSLAEYGYQIRIATNNLESASRLKVLGFLGQIEIIKIKIDSELDIKKALDGSFLAINFIEPNSLKTSTLIKAYQTLPLLIAKNNIKFIHFSSIISNENNDQKITNIQNVGNKNIISKNKNTTVLKLPTFTIGNTKPFENIGNIVKNLNVILNYEHSQEKEICIFNASDLGQIILKIIKNNIHGEFDLFSQKIKIIAFFEIITKSCGSKKISILNTPKFVFSFFTLFCKFQRIIDTVVFEKTKITFINEIPHKKFDFSPKVKDLTKLIINQFEQFNVDSELSPNKYFNNKEYYPNS